MTKAEKALRELLEGKDPVFNQTGLHALAEVALAAKELEGLISGCGCALTGIDCKYLPYEFNKAWQKLEAALDE